MSPKERKLAGALDAFVRELEKRWNEGDRRSCFEAVAYLQTLFVLDLARRSSRGCRTTH
jgi:hypothetical protein